MLNYKITNDLNDQLHKYEYKYIPLIILFKTVSIDLLNVNNVEQFVLYKFELVFTVFSWI